MTTIAEQLQPASWRGVKFPFTGARDFGFQQEQANHRFIFRDEQLIESIGRQNPTFRYPIPFRDGVRRPPWKNLFTEVYPRFLDACTDRSAGELIDPVHGTFRAKCMSLRETLTTDATDGVEVVAEFVFAPEAGDSDPVQFAQLARTLDGLADTGVVFGAAVGNISEEQRQLVDSINQQSERPETSVFGVARQASSLVQQTKNRTRAQLNRVSADMEVTRSEIEKAKDPELEPLRRDASRFSLASRNLAKTAGDPRTPFDTIRTTAEIGRIAFAVSVGVPLGVLLDLNPSLEEVLMIPEKTTIKLPKSRG